MRQCNLGLCSLIKVKNSMRNVRKKFSQRHSHYGRYRVNHKCRVHKNFLFKEINEISKSSLIDLATTERFLFVLLPIHVIYSTIDCESKTNRITRAYFVVKTMSD